METVQNHPYKILLIDDDEDDFVIIQGMLEGVEGQRYRLEWAENYKAGIDALQRDRWDAVLVDYDLGDKNGIQLISEAVSDGIKAPFIMVTGRGNREKDVEAMQAGASDYITKMELSSPLLERVIRYSFAQQRVEQELERRVEERTQELQTALEELTVMEEELRNQFDELADVQFERESEYAHYKELYEYAPLGYLVTDKHGIIMEANFAAAHLLNTEKKFLKGKPLGTNIAEEYKTEFWSKLGNFGPKKGLQEWKVRIVPRGLDPVTVRMITSPIKDQEGNLFAVRWLIIKESGSPS
jgi:DNA-binding response OmpR family regulator